MGWREWTGKGKEDSIELVTKEFQGMRANRDTAVSPSWIRTKDHGVLLEERGRARLNHGLLQG